MSIDVADTYSTDLFWIVGPDGEIDSTAATFLGATSTLALRARELNVPLARMRLIWPPDVEVPVQGGPSATMTARALGRPLTIDHMELIP